MEVFAGLAMAHMVKCSIKILEGSEFAWGQRHHVWPGSNDIEVDIKESARINWPIFRASDMC